MAEQTDEKTLLRGKSGTDEGQLRAGKMGKQEMHRRIKIECRYEVQIVSFCFSSCSTSPYLCPTV